MELKLYQTIKSQKFKFKYLNIYCNKTTTKKLKTHKNYKILRFFFF